MAKTIITGQGVSGAALCLTPWAPVGVAVAGIAGIATPTTFCVDMYLNAKRARESKRILERDEFMKKMQRVMDKLGITDQDLLNARTDAESNKWMFDEDIDGVLQKIFKFITDYRHDFTQLLYRAARGSYEIFSRLGTGSTDKFVTNLISIPLYLSKSQRKWFVKCDQRMSNCGSADGYWCNFAR